MKIINLIAKWCRECNELYKLYEDRDVKKRIEEFEVEFYDIDEYPHLLERFNFGGLPSIAFVEDDKLYYGFAGVINKDEFTNILDSIRDYTPVKFREISEETPNTGEVNNSDLSRVLTLIEKNIDWLDGGFLGDYKLFTPSEYYFLLRIYMRKGVEGYLKIVDHTYTKIYMSGFWIRDLGGFSRFSYGRDWGKPDKIILSELNADAFKSIYFLRRYTGKRMYETLASRLAMLFYRGLYKDGFLRGIYRFDDKLVIDDRMIPHINYYTASSLLDISRYGEFKRLGSRALKVISKFKHEELEDKYRTLYTYTAVLECYVNAYMYSRSEEYLDRTLETIKIIREFKGHGGAYRDVKRGLFGSDIVRMIFKLNSRLAHTFLKIYLVTQDETFRNEAREILNYYKYLYSKYAPEVGLYGLALDTYINGLPVIEISKYDRGHSLKKIRDTIPGEVIFKWID